jgi:hypothetical protein
VPGELARQAILAHEETHPYHHFFETRCRKHMEKPRKKKGKKTSRIRTVYAERFRVDLAQDG